MDTLEARQLLATLQPIADVSVPQFLGRTVPLQGGTDPQIFTAESDNPDIRAEVVRGQFLRVDVTHASSGPGDPAFSGSLTFQLFDDLTPTTVARITSLVNQGFYTSPTTNQQLPTKNFHRVAAGFPDASTFIVQGGSANGDGTGEILQPGFPFEDEFRATLAFTGTGQLAMANAGPDTNSSQFFVTTGSPEFLNFRHTVFGQLVEGEGTLELMTQVSRGPNDAPIAPILITGTTLFETSPDGVVLIDATSAQAGQTANITVTANDPSDETTATQQFQVTIGTSTVNNRPFLEPIDRNQFVGVNQTAQFTLGAVSTEPDDVLTFAVGGGVAPDGTFAPVENATASVDAQGNVTIVPDLDFEGAINLLVGVRDQIDRVGNINAVGNFDTQQITLTVTDNTPPIAFPVSATTLQNEPVVIQLVGETGDPDTGQTLEFILTSEPSSGTISEFNSVTGTLLYTPVTNFVGTDGFTYRVRDVGEPTPNLDSNEATVTIHVEPGVPINVRPTALPVQATVDINTPTQVQLLGETGNPESDQTLFFEIDTTVTIGAITDFDPNTGLLTYTPPPGFVGTDTLSFTVTDVGEPTPNLTSEPALATFEVVGAVNTGTLRQIGAVLIVTPNPKPLRDQTPNVIHVSLVDDRITVTVNGLLDEFRPQAQDIERLVVYGSKASDQITVGPEVPITATLNGGGGGQNRIQAGGAPSRLHGWFGFNVLTGGPFRDELIGRMGRVRFRPSAGDDLLFAGEPNRFPQLAKRDQPIPPTGTFFRFVNGRLVALPTPPPRVEGRIVTPIPIP